MDLLKIENLKLNEHYFDVKNKFNLKTVLYPMPKFSTTVAIFATHYGSVNNLFKLKNEPTYTKVVDGVAHYLEHKLLENKQNLHTFNLFAQTGAKANAFTSFDTTAYYFSCTDNFEKSLKILMDVVQTPYFTAENVLKERGIIEQELQMYYDEPESRVFENCLKALYFNHPIRINIGGTVQSIAQINEKLLYDCYNAFYSLNNMGLLIAGNFNLNSTLDIIKNNLNCNLNSSEIETTPISEPEEVNKKLIKVEMSIMLSYFCFGYKLKPESANSALKNKIIFEIICELIVGEGSFLFNKFYEQNLVSGGCLSYDILICEGCFCIIFSGLSNRYEEVYKLLNDEIDTAINKGFDESFFELVKKSAYCDYLLGFDSVDKVSGALLDSFSLNCDVYDALTTVSNLTLNEINTYVKKIQLQNSAISVAVPLNK